MHREMIRAMSVLDERFKEECFCELDGLDATL
jgi:hypothetical protein